MLPQTPLVAFLSTYPTKRLDTVEPKHQEKVKKSKGFGIGS
jgi:hypothetical protein